MKSYKTGPESDAVKGGDFEAASRKVAIYKAVSEILEKIESEPPMTKEEKDKAEDQFITGLLKPEALFPINIAFIAPGLRPEEREQLVIAGLPALADVVDQDMQLLRTSKTSPVLVRLSERCVNVLIGDLVRKDAPDAANILGAAYKLLQDMADKLLDQHMPGSDPSA
jgi:hypothetical protein